MANSIKKITTEGGDVHNLGNIEIAAVKAVELGTNAFEGDLTLVGGKQIAGSKQEVKTGDVGTLTAAHSGALVSLSGGARTVILPAVATAGVNFKIVAGSAHAHVVSASSGEAKLQGVAIDLSNASTVSGSQVTAANAIKLVNPKVGDSVSCVSDGTNWHVLAYVNNSPIVE